MSFITSFYCISYCDSCSVLDLVLWLILCIILYLYQVLDIAETGDAGEIDMLVRDIYGGDCK